MFVLLLLHNYADCIHTYTGFVAEARVERVVVFGEEFSYLLQTLNLELLWSLLYHLPVKGVGQNWSRD